MEARLRGKPILFSKPMVSALLAGTKTQTRRVVKPQPPAWANFCEQPLMLNVLIQWVPSGLWRWAELDDRQQRQVREWPVDEDGAHYWLRPTFAKGDRLYVREAWRVGYEFEGTSPRNLIAAAMPVLYEADAPHTMTWPGRFRQGMHMPRWASRLTLIVTDVRVQRLQDISEADAGAEGGAPFTDEAGLYHSARDAFWLLWDGLNADRGYGWDANPWVTATTFEVIKQNIDQIAEAA